MILAAVGSDSRPLLSSFVLPLISLCKKSNSGRLFLMDCPPPCSPPEVLIHSSAPSLVSPPLSSPSGCPEWHWPCGPLTVQLQPCLSTDRQGSGALSQLASSCVPTHRRQRKSEAAGGGSDEQAPWQPE